MMTKPSGHKWEFRTRFRRHAFGWKSQPAIKRIKEAVSEIKKVARKDKMLAAEGAVLLLEKVSPALEQVDSSSGAIGTAVNNAIEALVEIIAAAPADENTRDAWLERLWEAYQDDGIPYIELLGDTAACAAGARNPPMINARHPMSAAPQAVLPFTAVPSPAQAIELFLTYCTTLISDIKRRNRTAIAPRIAVKKRERETLSRRRPGLASDRRVSRLPGGQPQGGGVDRIAEIAE